MFDFLHAATPGIHVKVLAAAWTLSGNQLLAKLFFGDMVVIDAVLLMRWLANLCNWALVMRKKDFREDNEQNGVLHASTKIQRYIESLREI